ETETPAMTTIKVDPAFAVVRVEVVPDDMNRLGRVSVRHEIHKGEQIKLSSLSGTATEDVCCVDVVGGGQHPRALSLVLEFPASHLPWRWQSASKPSRQRLHAGLLVDAKHDLAWLGRVDVEGNDLSHLAREFRVGAVAPHPVVMRFQIDIVQDTTNG